MARVTPVLDQFLDRARTLALWLRMQSCQVLLVLVGHAVMPKSAGEACRQSWSAASPERAIASERVIGASPWLAGSGWRVATVGGGWNPDSGSNADCGTRAIRRRRRRMLVCRDHRSASPLTPEPGAQRASG